MQGDASRSLLLDASQFYDSSELSDVTIVLVEESEQTEERAVKRQRTGDGADGVQHAAAAGPAAHRPTVHLHGHRFLLSACSSVFQVRISKWSEGDGNELVLHVPSLEVGETRWPKLLQLPYTGLLQLLLNKQTRVARENTVVYVIARWAAAQQQQLSLQQMQQLFDTIHMLHCSPLYAATVLPAWPLLAQCFTPQELALANMLASSTHAYGSMSRAATAAGCAADPAMHQLQIDQLGVMRCALGAALNKQRKAWRMHRRPSSTRGGAAPLLCEHTFSLSALQAAVDGSISRASAGNSAQTIALVWRVPAWQGRTYAARLHAMASNAACAAPGAAAAPAAADAAADASPAAGTAAAAAGIAAAGGAAAAALAAAVAGASGVSCTLQLSLSHGQGMPAASLGYMVYRIRVLPAPRGTNLNDAPAHRAIETPWCQARLSNYPCKADKNADIFELGAFRTYVECERKLREQGLVHSGGTLKMQLLIKDVQ